jgi:hypothetical protein
LSTRVIPACLRSHIFLSIILLLHACILIHLTPLSTSSNGAQRQFFLTATLSSSRAKLSAPGFMNRSTATC